jgi:hypothetical protein
MKSQKKRSIMRKNNLTEEMIGSTIKSLAFYGKSCIDDSPREIFIIYRTTDVGPKSYTQLMDLFEVRRAKGHYRLLFVGGFKSDKEIVDYINENGTLPTIGVLDGRGRVRELKHGYAEQHCDTPSEKDSIGSYMVPLLKKLAMKYIEPITKETYKEMIENEGKIPTAASQCKNNAEIEFQKYMKEINDAAAAGLREEIILCTTSYSIREEHAKRLTDAGYDITIVRHKATSIHDVLYTVTVSWGSEKESGGTITRIGFEDVDAEKKFDELFGVMS